MIVTSSTSAAVAAPATTSPPGASPQAASSSAPQKSGATRGASTAARTSAAAKAGTATRAGTATKASSATKAGTATKASSATKAGTAQKSGASTSGAGYATPISAELAFLRDPALSIEEKLFRFMKLMASRGERELQARMEAMGGGSVAGSASTTKATAASATSAAGSSPSGSAKPATTSRKPAGLWGVIKSVIPVIGAAEQLIGKTALKGLVKQVTGPVLTAAAAALGGPALGAVVAKLGPALGTALTSEGAASSGSGSTQGTIGSAGGSSTAAASGEPRSEQLEMMELQRLVEKQNEMFAMLSNVLRSMHDTRMGIVANLRA
jgi:hypothetical protein